MLEEAANIGLLLPAGGAVEGNEVLPAGAIAEEENEMPEMEGVAVGNEMPLAAGVTTVWKHITEGPMDGMEDALEGVDIGDEVALRRRDLLRFCTDRQKYREMCFLYCVEHGKTIGTSMHVQSCL